MEENISNEEFIEEVTKIINCNEEIEGRSIFEYHIYLLLLFNSK